jgi:hypothetical protein
MTVLLTISEKSKVAKQADANPKPHKNERMPDMSAKTSAPSNGAKSTASPGALKLHDARQYLGGLSVPTMHRLIQRGLLKPNRSLRHLLFPVAELDRFLRDGMT